MPFRHRLSEYAFEFSRSFIIHPLTYFVTVMQAAQIRSANPQYCSNVCMKLNAKLGGTTCRIVSKNPKNSDFFSVPTMILGADVSHPSPGSPQASMAAVSMSLDGNACRYAVAVQTNGYR